MNTLWNIDKCLYIGIHGFEGKIKLFEFPLAQSLKYWNLDHVYVIYCKWCVRLNTCFSAVSWDIIYQYELIIVEV